MSPRMRWIVLSGAVCSYLVLVLVVLLRPSEGSPFPLLCVALATLAVGAVSAAALGFRVSGSGRHLTLQARLARVPDWLAHSLVFLGAAFALLSFVFVFPRTGMGEFQQPALITGICLYYLGYLCEPRWLFRRG